MGQTNPKESALDTYSLSSSFHEDQSQVGDFVDPEPNDGVCCTTMICRPKRQVDNQEWKVFLQRRLEAMKTKEWPKLLQKTLKPSDHVKADRTYQTEIFQVETRAKRSEIEREKLKALCGSEVELRDHSKIGFSHQSPDQSLILSKKQSTISDQDQMGISTKIYDFTEDEKWMKNTYDIRGKEDREAVINSIDYLKSIQHSTKTLENANTSIEKKHLENRVSSYRPKYDNFTVIIESGPENPNTFYNKAAMEGNKQRYKVIFNIIEKHLNTPDNIFRKLINQFELYFVKNYQTVIETYRYRFGSIKNTEIKTYVDEATTDLQQFIGLMYETVALYYRLEKVKKNSDSGCRKILNRDNVMNFISSIVFSQKVYDVIFDLYSIQEADVETLYKKNLKLCASLSPEDFDIADEYCLNTKTILMLKKENRFKKAVSSRDSTRTLSDDTTLFDSGELVKSGRNSSVRRESLEESRLSSEEKIPYKKAIAMLSDLKNRRSPIHKLKNIVKVAELISKSIDAFYKSCGTVNKKKLDADQTLSLFIYLVAKSNISNLGAHYKIIEKFTTCNVLNSTAGYYATTLGACVACICSMDFKRNSTVQEADEDLRRFLRSSKIGSVVSNSSITYSGKIVD